jgi:hypothetical protein
MTAEPRRLLYEASIALLRGKSALHICTYGGDVAGAGRRKALRRAVVGLAIRLLNSGKILYTLNRADRFGAGGEAAAGPSLVDVNVAAREGQDRLTNSPFRGGNKSGIIAYPVRNQVLPKPKVLPNKCCEAEVPA